MERIDAGESREVLEALPGAQSPEPSGRDAGGGVA